MARQGPENRQLRSSSAGRPGRSGAGGAREVADPGGRVSAKWTAGVRNGLA